MIVAQRFRPRFWHRLLRHARPFTATVQHLWDDAWLDRCRQRLGEPYVRLMVKVGTLQGRRLNVINPADHPLVDEAGDLFDELNPLQRLAKALDKGADPSVPFALALEGVTRGGRRRLEHVLNAEFPIACAQIRARMADAAQHLPGNAEALSSRQQDPLYPPLPRHWKEARTALDWCLLLGDDEAIERLGLVHRTLSEQDQAFTVADRIAVRQGSVLSASSRSQETLSTAHEARWHRTARRLEDLTDALAATRLGELDDATVPQIARGGDFRTIVDSADIDTLDADGKHVYHALLEGRNGPVRQHAQQGFWQDRYAVGERPLPEAWRPLPAPAGPVLADDRTDRR